MFVSDETIKKLEEKYGSPRIMDVVIEMTPSEFELLRSSMKNGRAHDITLFIFRNGDIAVIRKPLHPPGVYRAPSGGVNPGEDFEEGAKREAYEETGLEIELKRYILRVNASFICGDEREEWTSHVFKARWVRGELNPIDRKEISGARWVSIEELQTSIRERLISSGMGGLKYRAILTDAAIEEIKKSCS
ncbi:MAG: NUDIX hydrolase [Candidatus Syntropharchaeia archaeon]